MPRRLLLLTTILWLSAAPAAMAQKYVTVVQTGTLREICAPWDGPAFSVTLDGRVSATVYTSFPDIEKGGAAQRFHSGPNPAKAGDALITMCDTKMENCHPKRGDVSITTIDGDIVTGTIQLLPVGWGSNTTMIENYTFRVKYDRAKTACK